MRYSMNDKILMWLFGGLAGLLFYLFITIFELNASVKDLATEVKLIQQHNTMSSAQWNKRGEIVEDYRKIVGQLSDRINRLEWHLDEADKK